MTALTLQETSSGNKKKYGKLLLLPRTKCVYWFNLPCISMIYVRVRPYRFASKMMTFNIQSTSQLAVLVLLAI